MITLIDVSENALAEKAFNKVESDNDCCIGEVIGCRFATSNDDRSWNAEREFALTKLAHESKDCVYITGSEFRIVLACTIEQYNSVVNK